jgi:hypothetical protein
MKKLSNVLYAGLIIVVFQSCGGSSDDFEKHTEKFNDCVEEKKDEKKYKYNNIQEALNAYDFAVARDYLACHPDRDHYWNGEKQSRESEILGTTNPYRDDLKLIVTAEVTYFVSQGEYKKAESTAKEAEMMDVYDKIAGQGFEDKLDEMVEKQEYKKVFNYLLNKKEETQKVSYDLEEGVNGNTNYMNSVRQFNADLDKVLSKYKYYKVDNSEIKLLIDLSLPELENKNPESSCGGCEGTKLVDVYKKQAVSKYLQ